jgi:uncharacterized protein YegL
MSNDLQSLFGDSQQSGMSHQSIDLMVQNLDGQTGLGCVGAQVDDLNTDDVTLVVMIMDESSSMSNVHADVIDAFNQMTRALNDSKASDSILMSAWTFSDKPKLLFGYTPIDKVQDLTTKNYKPNGSTALYDAVLDGFTGIVAYGQDLRNNGIRTRAIVVVISDGGDNVSQQTAHSVKTIADDLIKQEFYTLAYIGMGHAVSFQQIADSMGFPEVLTITNTASEFRRALNMVSASIIRTSTGQINPGQNNFFTP